MTLVVTSVTRPDGTGGAAPGTELLLAAAERIQASGRRVLVGLHPREDRTLWERYEISDVPTLRAAARAEAAIGIPGTVFPLIAALGTPLVGCTDPALTVPGHLLSVCSSTIADAMRRGGRRRPRPPGGRGDGRGRRGPDRRLGAPPPGRLGQDGPPVGAARRVTPWRRGRPRSRTSRGSRPTP